MTVATRRWFGELAIGTAVASLGFSAAESPAPVFAGDRGHNQRDELVCLALRAALMKCRPDE